MVAFCIDLSLALVQSMPNKPIKCGTAKAWLSFATLHSLAKHLSAPYWGVR